MASANKMRQEHFQGNFRPDQGNFHAFQGNFRGFQGNFRADQGNFHRFERYFGPKDIPLRQLWVGAAACVLRKAPAPRRIQHRHRTLRNAVAQKLEKQVHPECRLLLPVIGRKRVHDGLHLFAVP